MRGHTYINFRFVLDRTGRDIRFYLDNSFELILVGVSAFIEITALSAVIRMDKERQTYKQEDETDGKCVKCKGEEQSMHRFGVNARKEVTLGRPKNTL